MSYFILLLSLILFVLCLKKFKYNFNGVELIIFWEIITISLLFPSLVNVMNFSLLYLSIYYLIRLIKTNKYITLPLFILNFVLSIISINVYDFFSSDLSWGSLLLGCFSLGIIFYMLILNVIVFIVRKLKVK